MPQLLVVLAVTVVVGLVTYRLAAARANREYPVVTVVPGAAALFHARRVEALAGGPGASLPDLPVLAGQPHLDDLDAGSTSGGDSRLYDFVTNWKVVAAGATVDTVAPILGGWSSVDPNVFEAFSQYTHEQVSNIFDLAKVVDAHAYKLASEQFQTSIGGHVSEFLAQDHLMRLGLPMQVPHASNNAGPDLVHDSGFEVNVKDYADLHSSGIAEHFATYPDVPVLVPGDITHLTPDAVILGPDTATVSALDGHSVIVDPSLVHGAGSAAAVHAFEQLDPGVAMHGAAEHLANFDVVGAADAFGVHLPFVTLAISGTREFMILDRGDTTVSRALGNVSLDVGGVAIGGAVGAKAGAVAGAVVGGPVGALVGGLLGAVAGGLTGRMAASTVRHMPLRLAVESCQDSREKAAGKAKRADKKAQDEWKSKLNIRQRDFQDQIERTEDEYLERANSVRREAEHATVMTRQEAATHLERSGAAVEWLVEQAAAKSPSGYLSGYVKFLGMRRLRISAESWGRQAARALGSWSDDRRATEGVLDLALASPYGVACATEFSDRVVRVNAAAYKDLATLKREADRSLVTARADALLDLDETWRRIEADVQAELAPALRELETAVGALEHELRAAGKGDLITRDPSKQVTKTLPPAKAAARREVESPDARRADLEKPDEDCPFVSLSLEQARSLAVERGLTLVEHDGRQPRNHVPRPTNQPSKWIVCAQVPLSKGMTEVYVWIVHPGESLLTYQSNLLRWERSVAKQRAASCADEQERPTSPSFDPADLLPFVNMPLHQAREQAHERGLTLIEHDGRQDESHPHPRQADWPAEWIVRKQVPLAPNRTDVEVWILRRGESSPSTSQANLYVKAMQAALAECPPTGDDAGPPQSSPQLPNCEE